TLAAGQSATLQVTSQTGNTPALALFGAGPSHPALTLGLPAGAGQTIFDFKVPVSGVYYAAVHGAAGDPYTLVVTRGATLAPPPGNGQPVATDISNSGQALGNLPARGPVIANETEPNDSIPTANDLSGSFAPTG